MPNPTTVTTPVASLPPFAPLAGFLSYLVPGLGQIVQGRVGKGMLFLVCLYGLFFGGMYLGDWKNVYLPDSSRNNRAGNWPALAYDLYNRPQYLGQFWIGVAAWPAIWQYNDLPRPDSPFCHQFERMPPESDSDRPAGYEGKTIVEMQRDGDKTWDLGWIYTVIAGVLNVLVIYDAAAGPALQAPDKKDDQAKEPART